VSDDYRHIHYSSMDIMSDDYRYIHYS